MNRRLAAATLGAVLSGCGGDDARTPPTASPSPSPSRAVATCEQAGIDARRGREGTCRVGDVVRTVADRANRLVIDGDVAMRILRVRRSPAGGNVALTVTLAVTNLGSRAVRWPSHPRQAALYLEDRLVPQIAARRRAALAAVSASAPVSVRLAPKAAGRVALGWLLEPAAAAAVGERGSAVIVVPPEEAAYGVRHVEGALRIGVLRLWR